MTTLTPDARRWGRALTMTAAAAFVVSSLITLLLALDVSAPAPGFGSLTALPDRILVILQNETARFPQQLIAAILLGVSFLALAGLAPVLRRLFAADDWQGVALERAFVLAGGIGIVAELAFIGGQAVASDASYCQCDYANTELIARGGVLDLVGSLQQWLLYGSLVVFAIGLVLLAAVARGRGARGWGSLSLWLGVLLAATAVFGAGFPPLANAMGWDLNVDLVTGVPSLVALLAVLPWWLLWLRRLLSEPSPAG